MQKHLKTTYRIGTSGWRYQHWLGKFYPKTIKKKEWFAYYSQYFSTVEINATFYHFFKDDTYKQWYEQAPVNFQYVLKIPQIITHRKYLKNVTQYIRDFEKHAYLLKEKLGLLLMQLHPHMPYDLDRLKIALSAFKNPSKVVVEFRNAKWMKEETIALLKQFNAIFCCADSELFPLKKAILTSKIAYIRLHGKENGYNYNYTKTDLNHLANYIHTFAKKGAKTIYVFFNNDGQAYAPQNALVLNRNYF